MCAGSRVDRKGLCHVMSSVNLCLIRCVTLWSETEQTLVNPEGFLSVSRGTLALLWCSSSTGSGSRLELQFSVSGAVRRIFLPSIYEFQSIWPGSAVTSQTMGLASSTTTPVEQTATQTSSAPTIFLRQRLLQLLRMKVRALRLLWWQYYALCMYYRLFCSFYEVAFFVGYTHTHTENKKRRVKYTTALGYDISAICLRPYLNLVTLNLQSILEIEKRKLT